jgi:hypothetical protein
MAASRTVQEVLAGPGGPVRKVDSASGPFEGSGQDGFDDVQLPAAASSWSFSGFAQESLDDGHEFGRVVHEVDMTARMKV